MFDSYEDLREQLTPELERHEYLTNGKQLVEVLEHDRSGVLAEDVCSQLLVSIEARDCCEGEHCPHGSWHQVIAEESEPETVAYQRIIEEHPVEGKRLGRHVLHDPRSKDPAYAAAQAPAVRTAYHAQRGGLPLNQGQVGKCTAEALAAAGNIKPNAIAGGRIFTDGDTDRIYEQETKDEGSPWTPGNEQNDIGGSGLAVCKAGVEMGFLKSYTHAFGLGQALAALTIRPVIFGVDWYEGFDSPDANGNIKIAGQVRGGHEICANGLSVAAELVYFWQSWGAWGYNGTGRVSMSWNTLTQLLSSDGDATVPIFA